MWEIIGATAAALMLGVFIGLWASVSQRKILKKRLHHIERLQEIYFKEKH